MVTVGSAAAHEILLKGDAQLADPESFGTYDEWCEDNDVEPVDIDGWDRSLAVYDGFREDDDEDEDDPDEDDEEGEESPPNLLEVPVGQLADALAELDDADLIAAMANEDERTTAQRHYAGRVAELQANDQEADEPEPEAGDG